MIVFAFVIYHPNTNFYRRIELLCERNETVAVFLNSPLEKILCSMGDRYKNLLLFGNGDNAGLGKAFRELFDSLGARGFRYMVFFDQDTGFSSNTIDSIYKVNLNSLFSDKYSSIQMLDPRLAGKLKLTNGCPAVYERKLIINSGSIFDLHKISKFDFRKSTYFVDGVDYDFCLRSICSGFKCGVTHFAPDIDHCSEQGDSCIKIFGRAVTIRRYSWNRIVDYNRALIRLILTSMASGRLIYTAIFSKHWAAYNLKAVVAYVFLANGA